MLWKRACIDSFGLVQTESVMDWEDNYKKRYLIEMNWKHSRCTFKQQSIHSMKMKMCYFEPLNVLALGSYSGKLSLVSCDGQMVSFEGTCSISCLCMDHQWLCVGSYNREAVIWDWLNKSVVGTLRGGHINAITCISIHPKWIITGGVDKTLVLWNRLDLTPLHSFEQSDMVLNPLL
jgi:WD40 repeat protein